MRRRDFLKTAAGTATVLAAPGIARAETFTLRLHQFLPTPAPLPSRVFVPWGERVAEATDGRIRIAHFDGMSLGGRPNDLMDQARDGIVDIACTLPGYTPGRFPVTEVIELPFMMTSPVATAKAYWEMVETGLQDSEYRDVKVLGAWCHGPGLIHSTRGVSRLEDLRNMTVRGPTRVINDLLSELGAEPVGLPLPAIPEALSKGVIEATVIPWEVTTAIRLSELLGFHTEFAGTEALYTSALIMVMNRPRFEALPADLQAILEAESGAAFSAFAAQTMWDLDAPARQIAVDAGNRIDTLDEAEVARWKAAAAPVIDRWVAEMNDKGLDGAALVETARGLIAKHDG